VILTGLCVLLCVYCLMEKLKLPPLKTATTRLPEHSPVKIDWTTQPRYHAQTSRVEHSSGTRMWSSSSVMREFRTHEAMLPEFVCYTARDGPHFEFRYRDECFSRLAQPKTSPKHVRERRRKKDKMPKDGELPSSPEKGRLRKLDMVSRVEEKIRLLRFSEHERLRLEHRVAQIRVQASRKHGFAGVDRVSDNASLARIRDSLPVHQSRHRRERREKREKRSHEAALRRETLDREREECVCVEWMGMNR
jgi:hypothetical protein